MSETTSASTTITLADGTVLPDCRPDLLNVADLMARRWSLIPVKYKSKLPAIRWQDFQKRFATFDEIEAWFTRAPFNVGVVTGRISGIFVVDADSSAALQWATDNLPACELRVRTAKGLHLYYPYSGDRPIRNKVRVKCDGKPLEIDIRADGGFVVAPGSTHESGFTYAREGDGWRWS